MGNPRPEYVSPGAADGNNDSGSECYIVCVVMESVGMELDVLIVSES